MNRKILSVNPLTQRACAPASIHTSGLPLCAPASAPAQSDKIGLIEITNLCNAQCSMCYMSSEKLNQIKRKQYQGDIFSLIGRLLYLHQKGVDSISFLGGEPTISNKLTTLVSIARRLGFNNVNVHTNGLRANTYLITNFLQHRAKITVSLYGLTNEQGDCVLSVKGGHNLAIKNVLKYIQSGLNVHLCFIGNMSVAEVQRYISDQFLIEDYSVPSFSIHPVVNRGRAVNSGLGEPIQKCCCNHKITYIDYFGEERSCVFT